MSSNAAPAPLLWTPSPAAVAGAEMTKFRLHVEQKYNVVLADYAALHEWSVTYIAEFWEEVWDWMDVLGEKGDKIIDPTLLMSSIPAWFKNSKLNWAENQLRSFHLTDPNKVALIETCEPLADLPASYTKTTHLSLHTTVHLLTLSLRSLSLSPGQILAYYGPTSLSSVLLCLATTAIGAIWTSAAADFGPTGVLERFEQFGEKLWGVVGVQAVRYNGKRVSQRGKLDEVVKGLGKGEKKEVIMVDYLGEGHEKAEVGQEGWRTFEDLLEIGRREKERLGIKEGEETIEYYREGGFDHPLWVLFSSGTTGKPKPIVHRAGGMLLQSGKEHRLHGGMGIDDVFFYYTTPGWMMFNYLISGLSTGATLILFDGSPLHRPSLLWDIAQDLGITIFGTSAKYLDVLSKSYAPIEHHKLEKLKMMLSTGSPLKGELFEWVYKRVKHDILVGSITGGTDICSLFGAHNVVLPVYRGEIQCLALGMAVEAWSEEGKALERGGEGNLVCVKPFVCMPVYFWNDVNGERYRDSYFAKFVEQGVWDHGDHCLITPSQGGNGGGLIMLGRSDGVLNPSGIRFGSSEIYEVLDTFSPSLPAAASSVATPFDSIVEDSLVVGQKIQGGSDERVVLFIKMCEGRELSDDVVKEIRARIRKMRSARHVPERIIAVKDIPHTINGKKVEIPIKKILAGAALTTINESTLRNPECLGEYVKLGEMLRREVE